jgi:hypothetical protein
MTRTILAAAAAMLLAPAAAFAAPDRTIELTGPPGATQNWSGTQATGLNVNYFNITEGHGGAWAEPGTCGKDVQNYCDTTLVRLTNPVPEEHPTGTLTRRVTVTIDEWSPPAPGTDYDLLAFASDEEGNEGAELARDAGFNDTETISFTLRTTRENPVAYALVRVVYFWAPNGTYRGTIR